MYYYKPKNFKMRFLLFFSCLLISATVWSQSKMACCASADFAALGTDEAFRDAHQTPRMDTLDAPLGKLIGIPTPGDTVQTRAYAYYIEAKQPTDKVLFVFHEWWGLNDNIKREADRYYTALDESAHVIAVDLFDYKKATTRKGAAKLMESVSEERISHILKGAFAIAGPDAKFATLGWCFGGTWSLQAAIEGGERTLAAVTFYGMPERDTERLALLESPVLAIFANQDSWITPELADEFETNMNELEKDLTIVRYDAEHAFANPSNEIFDEEAAEDAFERAVSYLRSHLLEMDENDVEE